MILRSNPWWKVGMRLGFLLGVAVAAQDSSSSTGDTAITTSPPTSPSPSSPPLSSSSPASIITYLGCISSVPSLPSDAIARIITSTSPSPWNNIISLSTGYTYVAIAYTSEPDTPSFYVFNHIPLTISTSSSCRIPCIDDNNYVCGCVSGSNSTCGGTQQSFAVYKLINTARQVICEGDPQSSLDWSLVRHSSPTDAGWHRTDDNALGTTSAYGTYQMDPTSTTSFSLTYALYEWHQIKVATGDGRYFAIFPRSALNNYSAGTDSSLLQLTRSSTSPSSTSIRWYNRGYLFRSDPWISSIDVNNTDDSTLLYAEDSITTHSTWRIQYGGANVWIQASGLCPEIDPAITTANITVYGTLNYNISASITPITTPTYAYTSIVRIAGALIHIKIAFARVTISSPIILYDIRQSRPVSSYALIPISSDPGVHAFTLPTSAMNVDVGSMLGITCSACSIQSVSSVSSLPAVQFMVAEGVTFNPVNPFDICSTYTTCSSCLSSPSCQYITCTNTSISRCTSKPSGVCGPDGYTTGMCDGLLPMNTPSTPRDASSIVIPCVLLFLGMIWFTYLMIRGQPIYSSHLTAMQREWDEKRGKEPVTSDADEEDGSSMYAAKQQPSAPVPIYPFFIRLVRSSLFRPITLTLLCIQFIIILAATAYNGMSQATGIGTITYSTLGYTIDGKRTTYDCSALSSTALYRCSIIRAFGAITLILLILTLIILLYITLSIARSVYRGAGIPVRAVQWYGVNTITLTVATLIWVLSPHLILQLTASDQTSINIMNPFLLNDVSIRIGVSWVLLIIITATSIPLLVLLYNHVRYTVSPLSSSNSRRSKMTSRAGPHHRHKSSIKQARHSKLGMSPLGAPSTPRGRQASGMNLVSNGGDTPRQNQPVLADLNISSSSTDITPRQTHVESPASIARFLPTQQSGSGSGSHGSGSHAPLPPIHPRSSRLSNVPEKPVTIASRPSHITTGSTFTFTTNDNNAVVTEDTPSRSPSSSMSGSSTQYPSSHPNRVPSPAPVPASVLGIDSNSTNSGALTIYPFSQPVTTSTTAPPPTPSIPIASQAQAQVPPSRPSFVLPPLPLPTSHHTPTQPRLSAIHNPPPPPIPSTPPRSPPHTPPRTPPLSPNSASANANANANANAPTTATTPGRLSQVSSRTPPPPPPSVPAISIPVLSTSVTGGGPPSPSSPSVSIPPRMAFGMFSGGRAVATPKLRSTSASGISIPPPPPPAGPPPPLPATRKSTLPPIIPPLPVNRRASMQPQPVPLEQLHGNSGYTGLVTDDDEDQHSNPHTPHSPHTPHTPHSSHSRNSPY